MKKHIILLLVAFAMFMETMDTTILNTAIPVMAQSLQVNPVDLKLALISYLLSLAVFIPISGWIADKFGFKKVFLFALFIFTLSSIWCGFTNSLTELIIARIFQGLGGSLTMPVGRLIILRAYDRQELLSKMSIVVMVGAMGMMLGPVLGGFITTHFSWRWIFWVNAPIGFLTMILSWYLLPHFPTYPVLPLDKLGFALFGTGLAALTFGLSAISESEIDNMYSILTIIISVILLLLYAKYTSKKRNAVVKLELLRERTFLVSIIGNLLARFGFGGLPFLLPLLLQIPLGFSPQLSGLLLAPTALGVLMVKPLSVVVLRALGYKKLLIMNTLFVALSIESFVLIHQEISIYLIAILTFIFGLLISLQYTGMNSLAYAKISEENMSAASSIVSTIQQLAQSFGVAVTAIFIKFFAASLPPKTSLTVRVFHNTLTTMSLLTLLSILIFLTLKKDDGRELLTLSKTN